MNQRVAFGLSVAKSKIHGEGCFAAIAFDPHQRIAEYVGERVSLAEAERRRCAQGEQRICDVYSEWAIDGSRGGNGPHLINHSCHPNAYVIASDKRIFIHALRESAPGEEITTDYCDKLYSDQLKCCWQTDFGVEPKNASGVVEQCEIRMNETDSQPQTRSSFAEAVCEG